MFVCASNSLSQEVSFSELLPSEAHEVSLAAPWWLWRTVFHLHLPRGGKNQQIISSFNRSICTSYLNHQVGRLVCVCAHTHTLSGTPPRLKCLHQEQDSVSYRKLLIMFPFGLFRDTSWSIVFQARFIPHVVAKSHSYKQLSLFLTPSGPGAQRWCLWPLKKPHLMIHLVQQGQVWPLVRKGRNILSEAPPQL